jgi:hypothetical protein
MACRVAWGHFRTKNQQIATKIRLQIAQACPRSLPPSLVRTPAARVFGHHFPARAPRFIAGNRLAGKLASLNFPLTMMDRARKNAYLCAQPCSSWRVYE